MACSGSWRARGRALNWDSNVLSRRTSRYVGCGCCWDEEEEQKEGSVEVVGGVKGPPLEMVFLKEPRPRQTILVTPHGHRGRR
jgi:hypothetical protein